MQVLTRALLWAAFMTLFAVFLYCLGSVQMFSASAMGLLLHLALIFSLFLALLCLTDGFLCLLRKRRGRRLVSLTLLFVFSLLVLFPSLAILSAAAGV
jgi:hypothetical protein